jgi:hypothetical protein
LPPRPKEWPSPQWKSFIAHDVHREYWRHFLDRLTQRGSEAKMSLLEQAGKEGCLPRLLAAGWTACAIEAFLALAPREGKWGGSREKLQKLKVLLDKMSCGEQGVTEAIQAAEKHVEEAAATTREEIQRTNVRGGILRYVDETAEMLGWLEQGRPLLVQYVSGFGSSAKTRAQTKRKSSRVSSGA